MLKYLKTILLLVIICKYTIFICNGIVKAEELKRYDGPGFIVFTMAETIKNSAAIDERLKLTGEATNKFEPPRLATS